MWWNAGRKRRDCSEECEEDRHLMAALMGMGCGLVGGWMLTISLWQGALEAQCESTGASNMVSPVSGRNGTWR